MMYSIRLRPKSTLKMGPEEAKDYAKQIQDLKAIRGHFLEIIIDIEEKIELLIRETLSPKDGSLKGVFEERVLHRRGMGLKEKKDLLEAILEVNKMLDSKELKEFIDSLEYVVTQRNRWAHGSIFFEQKTDGENWKMQSYLKYINLNGKVCEKILTDQYFDEINAKLKVIDFSISKILVKMKLLPEEELKRLEEYFEKERNG